MYCKHDPIEKRIELKSKYPELYNYRYGCWQGELDHNAEGFTLAWAIKASQQECEIHKASAGTWFYGDVIQCVKQPSMRLMIDTDMTSFDLCIEHAVIFRDWYKTLDSEYDLLERTIPSFWGEEIKNER